MPSDKICYVATLQRWLTRVAALFVKILRCLTRIHTLLDNIRHVARQDLLRCLIRFATLLDKISYVAWQDLLSCLTKFDELVDKIRYVAWWDPQRCMTRFAALLGKICWVAWQGSCVAASKSINQVAAVLWCQLHWGFWRRAQFLRAAIIAVQSSLQCILSYHTARVPLIILHDAY